MNAETAIYLNPAVPLPERAQDLIARLTLDEKVGLMSHAARGVPRLGIPAYNYWNESLHGVARNGRATVFPQAIGLAATWDRELILQVATAISDEARAKFHAALRRSGYSQQYQGLTFWSPNINLFRDPRWGRGQETWGEDPHLTGELAAAYVRGLQGDDPRYLKTAACAKHFAVHSGPEAERHTFDAAVSQHDLRESYLPAFKKLVTEAKVESVMGAYNRLFGEPCCASGLLLTQILRGEWGFSGHVVSDCGALSDFHLHHHVTADIVESAALALKQGCDLGCDEVFEHLPEAIERGLITEAHLDRALSRTLGTRFKLGLFDPPENIPYAQIPTSVIACDEHRALARRAAAESIVLLKNNGILPIAPNTKKLFVTGPTAANLEVLLGNYYGFNERMVTFLEGLTGRIPEGMGLEYHPGAPLVQPRQIHETWAPAMAQSADIAIICVGLNSMLEGEEGESLLSPLNGDRDSLALPAPQVHYIRELAAHGARIVLVVTGGSPVDLGPVESMAEAILFVWYPGMEGGSALAEVLFGDVSPSGKLPVTFPKSLADLPPFNDYRMAGRTYRYATAEPLYPFGFGLSYTQFEYHEMTLSQTRLTPGESLTASLILRNAGERSAAETAQLYLSPFPAQSGQPLQRLIAFQRVFLAPGETRRLEFTLPAESLLSVDEAGREQILPGEYLVTVGGASPSPRALALGAPKPVSAKFKIVP
ncbi:MAG: glycosyl hydrolase [Anaerolineae bacterium CG_4_9_14_3_um_filter_57_17]|nr:glycoside hydrolase family 3 protein [bacterium]NCT20457.1 glycoside hydrolase family 3 protein [bacterium]OIO83979.1 MAG: glycosyl hydrolase [Anaerolineae bacterium CG2_30_57_67]PJB65073.1 MAG: glycosyl hydrolase [Anaerolineae bacterium CG_4_9_14_3_um_filter_57_17]